MVQLQIVLHQIALLQIVATIALAVHQVLLLEAVVQIVEITLLHREIVRLQVLIPLVILTAHSWIT